MLILRDKNSALILCIIVVAVFFVQGSSTQPVRRAYHKVERYTFVFFCNSKFHGKADLQANSLTFAERLCACPYHTSQSEPLAKQVS